MAVHSKSVIPVWLKDFDTNFYNNLTRLENKLYTNKESTAISLPLTTVSPTAHHANITVTGNNLASNGLATTWKGALASVAFGRGRWYWEVTVSAIGDGYAMCGVAGTAGAVGSINWHKTAGFMINTTGLKYTAGGTGVAYMSACTTGTVIGLLLDTEANTITIYRNGVNMGVMFSGLSLDSYYPAFDIYNTCTLSVNFGETPFAYPVPAGGNSYTFQNLTDNMGVMTPIVSALTDWKRSIKTSKFNEFVGVVYGFNKFADLYSIDKSVLTAAKSKNIFKFNNAPKIINSAPDSYFLPTVAAGVNPNPVYGNIDSLASIISNSQVNDEANMNAVKNTLTSLIQNKTTSNILALDDSANLFKGQLGWDTAFKELNFAGIDLPHTLL